MWSVQSGLTPLHAAAKAGSHACFDFLVDCGVATDTKDNVRRTSRIVFLG
jgi:hypothetical protein